MKSYLLGPLHTPLEETERRGALGGWGSEGRGLGRVDPGEDVARLLEDSAAPNGIDRSKAEDEEEKASVAPSPTSPGFLWATVSRNRAGSVAWPPG